MFPCIAKKATLARKLFKSNEIQTRNMRVAILGAAGGIGSNLALLIKQCPLVSSLYMYDIAKHMPGVGLDLSHVETHCRIKTFVGPEQLPGALTGAQIVVIAAGFFRDKTMTRDDLFVKNAELIVSICEVCAVKCPNAIIMMITNPVNSLVPLAAEVMKKHNVFDNRKIVGVTTIDVVRANTFAAETICVDPRKVVCPVIGGHSTDSILPVFSQCCPKMNHLPDECIEYLIGKVQQAGAVVVDTKAIDGKGSAILATAYATARFITSVALAKIGQKCIIECTYAQNSEMKDLQYFATPCLLGIHGIEKSLGVPKLSKIEEKYLTKAIPDLKANIDKGLKFDFSKKKEGGKKKGCGLPKADKKK